MKNIEQQLNFFLRKEELPDEFRVLSDHSLINNLY